MLLKYLTNRMVRNKIEVTIIKDTIKMMDGAFYKESK